MRVAIYARFSSELQDERSITDQINAAREHASRQGWSVAAVYSDAAISGSSLKNRPGLLDLIAAAQERRFDAVLTESIDRLSRSQAGIAVLYEDLNFYGVSIETLSDGAVSELHVGLKGTMASLFLKDLAQKTRRGQVGRVKAGRIPGGRCYGYDVVAGDDRGKRVINEAEAEIIRRIFSEYVGGASPLSIAGRLNAEKVPAPRGGQWNASTINGSRKRLNGIISNQLYSGRIVYNRQRFIKDPSTGKRQARPNKPEDWLLQDVPDLRIAPADLFEAAQTKRAAHGSAHRLDRRRRPKHLLSGLAACGCCGAAMIVVRDDRVGCSAKLNKATCSMARTISLSEIESRVLSALQAHLLAPDIVAAAVEAYREERNRLAKDTARLRRDAERDLAAFDRKIAGIISAIEAGGEPRALSQRLNDLEAERRAAAARVAATGGAEVLTLHPEAASRYSAKVADIHSALSKGDAASREAVALVRELIDRIVVTPGEGGCGPLRLELTGNLAALMMEQSENRGATVSVAGPRNQI